MADVICIMRDGNIEQIGKPLDVYDRPANLFVAEFIGSPAMNILRGEVAAGEGRPVFRSGGLGAAAARRTSQLTPGQPVALRHPAGALRPSPDGAACPPRSPSSSRPARKSTSMPTWPASRSAP